MVENARKWLEDAWKMGDVEYFWLFLSIFLLSPKFCHSSTATLSLSLSLSRQPSETKNKQKQIWKNNPQR